MKKTLIIAIAIAMSINAFSQTSLGLKFGLNSNSFWAVGTQDKGKAAADIANPNYGNLIGFNFGLAFNSEMGDVGHFQMEISYSQKGNAAKHSKAFDRYTYIDFKPLFNLGGGGDKWRIYAQIGPSFNFWLSKASYDPIWGKFIPGSDKFLSATEDENAINNIRADFGVVLGFGFKYKVGPGWILLNPRYELGLAPHTIIDLGGSDDGGVGVMNRGMSLNMGYLFEF